MCIHAGCSPKFFFFFTLSRAFPHKPRGREASAGREMRIARTVAGYAAPWNDSRYELGIRILRVVSCLSRGLLAQETVRSRKQDSRRRRRAATRECFVSRTPVGYMNERPLLLDRAMRNKPGGLQAKSPRPRDLEVTLLERSGGAYYRTQTDACPSSSGRCDRQRVIAASLWAFVDTQGA